MVLMKSEQILAMRCIGEVILDGCAIGDVCATKLIKVTKCPINHRSADRCQQCQVHSEMTVRTSIIRRSINVLLEITKFDRPMQMCCAHIILTVMK